MKNYLSNLNERERWMVIIGGICLILYLYYAILYAPLANKVTQQSTLLTEKMQTLSWTQQMQKQAHAPKERKSVDNNQLLSILDTQLKRDEILKNPYQIQQTASGEIQISFDEVPFTLFMAWLAKLNDRYSIAVKQMNVDHLATPGVVRLSIILTTA